MLYTLPRASAQARTVRRLNTVVGDTRAHADHQAMRAAPMESRLRSAH